MNLVRLNNYIIYYEEKIIFVIEKTSTLLIKNKLCKIFLVRTFKYCFFLNRYLVFYYLHVMHDKVHYYIIST